MAGHMRMVGLLVGWSDGRMDWMTGQQLGLPSSAAFVFIRYGSRQANGDTCSRKINTPGASLATSLPLATMLA